MNDNSFTFGGSINHDSDKTFRQFGGLDAQKTGNDNSVTIDLQFRLATNGVIVNTLVNDEPLITTSAGYF